MAENEQYSKPKFQPVMQDATGKLPPRDTEDGRGGARSADGEGRAYMNVADILTADAFYDPVNAMIYEAISTLGLNQRPIDMMSVKEQLRRDGNLEKAGGAVHITELTARVLSAANVEYHAKIVAQKFLARRLISFASKIETEAFDESATMLTTFFRKRRENSSIYRRHISNGK